MNRPDEEREAASQWIEAKRTVTVAKLKEASAPISNVIE